MSWLTDVLDDLRVATVWTLGLMLVGLPILVAIEVLYG